MKATGIVRRIDDLGRVVIPKEIRRTLRIREGDPLEIFTDREGEIILKKYSPIGELGQFAQQYAEAISQTTGHIVCIADRDQIIAAAGTAKKDFLLKPISRGAEEMLTERNGVSLSSEDKNFVNAVDDGENYTAQVLVPIISDGDIIGGVIILSREVKEFSDLELKLAQSAAAFLGMQMEQ